MRHGRSLADDEMVHEGRYDSPLTDVGRAQVRSRAARWKRSGVTFDLIVASTLVRAAESARIVGEGARRSRRVRPRLDGARQRPPGRTPLRHSEGTLPQARLHQPLPAPRTLHRRGRERLGPAESRRASPAERRQTGSSLHTGRRARRHPQRCHVLPSGRLPAPRRRALRLRRRLLRTRLLRSRKRTSGSSGRYPLSRNDPFW